jgi:hypothetical protein
VKVCVVLAFCSSLFAAFAWCAEIGIGDPRDEVLRQLGKPSSIARRGNHELLLYPKGGRVEIVDGKVTDVKGPLPTPIVEPSREAPSATAAANQAPAPQPSATPPKAAPPSAPPPSTFATSDDYNPAIAANELAKHVEKMDTAWGMAPAPVEPVSPLDSIPSFLTGLLIRFVFTVVALKLAFKYWEMDAFWKGVFLIAGIDLVVHATFELLGPVTHGFTTMVAVENGIAGLVLIYTIHRFCFNKRIQNAVLTAAAVKVVVALCYIFAGLGTLNRLYG